MPSLGQRIRGYQWQHPKIYLRTPVILRPCARYERLTYLSPTKDVYWRLFISQSALWLPDCLPLCQHVSVYLPMRRKKGAAHSLVVWQGDLVVLRLPYRDNPVGNYAKWGFALWFYACHQCGSLLSLYSNAGSFSVIRRVLTGTAKKWFRIFNSDNRCGMWDSDIAGLHCWLVGQTSMENAFSDARRIVYR